MVTQNGSKFVRCEKTKLVHLSAFRCIAHEYSRKFTDPIECRRNDLARLGNRRVNDFIVQCDFEHYSYCLTNSLYSTDINECASGNGGCEHHCNNRDRGRGYSCSCRSGYTLLSGGRCRGEGNFTVQSKSRFKSAV